MISVDERLLIISNIPFMHFTAMTIGPPNETHGEVKGFSLLYSGNFSLEAEMGEMGRLRMNMGIHPMGLSWHLQPGVQNKSLILKRLTTY